MSFKVTVEKDGQVLDSIQTDCFLGAIRDEVLSEKSGEAHVHTLTYADCDDTDIVHVLKALMTMVQDLMANEDILAAIEADRSVPEEVPLDGGENN